ncbi:hypothetical protein ACN38_g9112 [Penicillium nordicum]|uniref:Uncharacterized protein n=1 Tax=Penicillium nordicum TaxID=229535 RepID=A0A0M8P464_9EURO|nr:hypothetical protein ACN38_g9112 [Penicillium nordicum]
MGYIGIVGHCLHNPNSGLNCSIARISPSALLGPSIHRHPKQRQPKLAVFPHFTSFAKSTNVNGSSSCTHHGLPPLFSSSSLPLLMSPEELAWIGELGAEGRRPGSSPLLCSLGLPPSLYSGLLNFEVLSLPSFVIVYCPSRQSRLYALILCLLCPWQQSLLADPVTRALVSS